MSSRHPGEATCFGIPNGKLETFLSTRGYFVKELIEPEQMQARYLTLRDGSVTGSVLALFNLALLQAG